MSSWMTNGATTLQFRDSDFQILHSTPKRKLQRVIYNTAKLPVTHTVSEATDRMLHAELSMFKDDKGDYAGADSLVSFFESADPSGVNQQAQTFMFTDADGNTYQCRFADENLAGGFRTVLQGSFLTASIRLLVEHTLPTDEATGPLLWLAAYDMDHNGGDLSAWTTADNVGGAGAEWEDKSGNDNDGVASATFPQWKNAGAGFMINSRPAVGFNGADDFLEVDGIAATFDGNSDTAWSFYAAYSLDDATVDRYILGAGGSTAPTDRVNFGGVDSASGGELATEIHDGSSGNEEQTLMGGTDVNPHIMTVICAGTTVSMWYDGDEVIADQAHNVGQIDTDLGRLGCQVVADTEGAFWDGRIGEVILFPGAHETIQRRRQEYRLADMWGISLSA